MSKLIEKILKLKFLVIAVTLILTVVCGFAMAKMNVNSDISEYLPDDAMSKKTLDFLKENFDIKGDAILAVDSNLTDYAKVKALAEKVEKVENIGTGKVLWLGSFEQMFPNGFDGELLPEQAQFLNKYYKKTDGQGTFLMYISLDVSNPTEQAFVAMDEVQKIAEESNLAFFLGGNAMQSKNMLRSALGDLPKFMLVAVVLILLILIFSTKSFIEPLIFLVSIGISIVLNMGTNFFLGSISTVTYSASAILQLALAMDYSIFLSHAFTKEIDSGLEDKDAMRNALKKTFVTVSASALTTAAGFGALLAMQFKLGFDMGIVLGKGVFLSLVTVLIFQPCLILALRKLMKKTEHKVFVPKFKLLQKSPFKIKWVAIVLAVMVFVPSVFGQSQVQYYYLNSMTDISATGPKAVVQDLGSQTVVAVPQGTIEKHKTFLAGLYGMNNETDQAINDITGYYTFVSFENELAAAAFDRFSDQEILGMVAAGQLPREDAEKLLGLRPLRAQMKSQFFKVDYTFYTLLVDGAAESAKAIATMEAIEKLANEVFSGESIYISGNTQVVRDMTKTTEVDFLIVAGLSAILIFLILLLTFKSFKKALLLVLVIELGIFVNLSITALLGVAINFMSYIIISAIQLGATVDYAILLTSKFDLNKKEMDNESALKKAISESAFSILVSASILVASCLSVYFLSSDIIIGEITMLIARGSAVSALIVLFLLPCFFVASKKKKGKGQDVEAVKQQSVPEQTNSQ